MKLRISVTKDILEKSKNCNDDAAYNCAIALAIIDVFPYAAVFSGVISIFNRLENERYVRVPMPSEATSFINTFDKSTPTQRAELSPISFEIDVPEAVIERINIEEITELLKDHTTLQIV